MMGQSSSQLEQPATSQVQVAQTSSPAPSVGTTASKALERDLQQSVAARAKKQAIRPLKVRKSHSGRRATVAEEKSSTKPRKKSRAAELRDEAKCAAAQSTISQRQEESPQEMEQTEVVDRPRKKRTVAPAAAPIPVIKEEPVDSPVEVEQPRKKQKRSKARDKDSQQRDMLNAVEETEAVLTSDVIHTTKSKADRKKQKRQEEAAIDSRERGRQSMVKDMVRVAEQPPQGVTADATTQLGSDEDIDRIIAGRELTTEDLNIEPETHGPYRDDAEKFNALRAHARNQLRAHLKAWGEEDLVCQGRAKWKKRANGEMYLKYAAPGKHFKDARTQSDKRTDELKAERRSNKVAACKRTLLAVIVRDERRRNPASKQKAAEENQGMGVDEDVVAALAHRSNQPGSAEYNPVNPAGPDAEEQVTDWLASQNEESPVPPDQLSLQAKSSKKRKRMSTYRDDDDDSFEAETVAPEDSNSVSTATWDASKTTKFVRCKKKNPSTTRVEAVSKNEQSGDGESDEAEQQNPKKSKSAGRTHASTTGPFTAKEKETADRVFDRTLKQQHMSEAEMAAKIKDWKRCGVFKDDMYAAFPDRTKDSVRKFAQRRYHGMDRGPWTEEQDKALIAANKLNPEQWTKISDYVGRTGPDCKDRWRLQLQYHDKALGPWSIEEEDKLTAAVEECVQAIISENSKDSELVRNMERLEALINWNAVAAKLGRTRSTKKCREKYEKLKVRKAKDDNAAKGYGESSTTRTNQHAKKAQSEKKEHERMSSARRIVKDSFELGDYYDALMEIHSAFKDREQQYHDEGNVLWSIISTKNINSRFSMTLAASSLRRVVYESAINDWLVNAPKMTKRVQKAKTVPAKAFILATWLEKQYSGRLQDMKRTYMPELVGKSAEEISQMKKAKKQGRAKTRAQRAADGKNSGLSKDFVTDSEDEEEEAANSIISASQGHGRGLSHAEAIATNDEDIEEIPETQEEAVEDEHSESDASSDSGNDDDDTSDEDGGDDGKERIADFQPTITETQSSSCRTPKLRSGWAVVNGTPVPETLRKHSPTLGSNEFVERCKKGGRR